MGEILGCMLVLYAVGKLLELAILKRLVSSFGMMTFVSSGLVFAGIFAAALANSDKPYALQPGLLISAFIAAIVLPLVRTFLHKRRMAKATSNATAA